MTLNSIQYHKLTSYQRNKIPQHFLDWENQPSTFKSYPGAKLIHLPLDMHYKDEKFFHVLRGLSGSAERKNPDIARLSMILGLGYSISAKSPQGGGFHYYRSAASAGALYPVEIYVATHALDGLADGLYHFSIAEHALVPLRDKDVTADIVSFLQGAPERQPSVMFCFTSIFFRSAWKYRDRAYRYNLLDTGHVIENMALATKAQGLSFQISYDFNDSKMNALLGLDESKEVCLALCYIPGTLQMKKNDKGWAPVALDASIKNACCVSSKEISYQAIQDIHSAGETIVTCSHIGAHTDDSIIVPGKEITKIEEPGTWPESLHYRETFLKRRSRRNFVPEPLDRECLMALLECLMVDDPCDVGTALESSTKDLVDIGFSLLDGGDYSPGYYVINRHARCFRMEKEGRFLELMAHICLDQKWIANAAVHFLLCFNLEKLERLWGARGYRYVMVHAGRLGERLYLAATAMGLGCCGIGAFYDMEAAQLLELESGSRLLYLLAVGRVKSM